MTAYEKLIQRELVNARRILANQDKFGSGLVDVARRIVGQHGA